VGTFSAICSATFGQTVGGVGRAAGGAGVVSESIRAQQGRPAIERLPGYSSELNPVDYI
jgi:hypothetical protein